MTSKCAFAGMQLRDAIALALRLGCGVEHKRKTGEYTIYVPGQTRGPLLINGRRRDAPRCLVSTLRKLEAHVDRRVELARLLESKQAGEDER